MLTHWHWLEYDSVALAALFTGIGLVALLETPTTAVASSKGPS